MDWQDQCHHIRYAPKIHYQSLGVVSAKLTMIKLYVISLAKTVKQPGIMYTDLGILLVAHHFKEEKELPHCHI